MIKTSIGEILNGNVYAEEDKRIYLIRDGNLPIYVGQSVNVCERIRDHCGFGLRVYQLDQLGSFILGNRPESLGWQVDLLTLEECELTARHYFPDISNFDVDLIEQALILDLGPCLNIKHNQNNSNRRQIPVGYKKNFDNEFQILLENTSPTTSISVSRRVTKPINQKNQESETVNPFSSYRQHLSPHSIRSQKTSLNLLSSYLNELRQVDNKTNPSDPEKTLDLFSNPEAWQNVTSGSVRDFIDWLIQHSYSISTINLHLSNIRKYATLVLQAGSLSQSELEKVLEIKNIYGQKAKRINDVRENQDIATRVGKRKSLLSIEITDEQANQLKSFPSDTIKGRRSNLLMSLLLDHGLQAEEISSLQIEQFDINSGVFSFERPNYGKQVFRLSPDTLNALIKVFGHRDLTSPGPLIMVLNRDVYQNKGIKSRCVNDLVTRIGKSIGIPNLSVSVCRNYWMKTSIESGSNLFALQRDGGWTSINTVLRYASEVKLSHSDDLDTAG